MNKSLTFISLDGYCCQTQEEIMKKSILIFLTISFLLTVLFVPASAKKVGKIKDGVYFDKDYKYSFQTPSGWSTKIGSKSKKLLKISMTQKSYAVPQEFQAGNEDYAQIPTIKVFVDTTSLAVGAFIKMLNDSEFKSPQKKFLMRSLKLISRPHEILKNRDLTLEGQKAIILDVRQAYSIDIATRGTDRAKQVNDYKAGSIFMTVRQGKIYIVHMITEYQTNTSYASTFGALIGSLRFDLD